MIIVYTCCHRSCIYSIRIDRVSKDLLHLVWECWVRPGKAQKHRFHNEKWRQILLRRQILLMIDDFILMNRDHATKEL